MTGHRRRNDGDLDPRHAAIYNGTTIPPFESWRLGPRLLAGRNPLSARDVEALAAAGVTHVLDLREESEWSGPGRAGSEAVAELARRGIERRSLPIGDYQAPTPADFATAADWLDAVFDRPETTLYAHCRAGVQRTATVLAAWKARRDGISFARAAQSLAADGYPGAALPGQREAAEAWLQTPAGRARRPAERPDLQRRIRASLLAGALGDALGAPIEFLSLRGIRARFGPLGLDHLEPAYGRLGAITDDTQMTLFTVEGLIRASVRSKSRSKSRGKSRGIGHPPAVVLHAYQRWLHTQGVPWKIAREPVAGGATEHEPDGWLVRERFLHARRAPGNTCLAALEDNERTGAGATNDSKGCGGVMRIAPVGFLPGAPTGEESEIEGVFRLGVEIAALTHGHPSGQLPAGVLAATIYGLARTHRPLARELDEAVKILRRWPRHEETLAAIEAALALAAGPGEPTAERVESLGAGWVAEEALAIALYAALCHPDDLKAALVLAANHSGDSDSTAAICGNLLGAALGEAALPADWLAELEGREIIERLADDFHAELTDTRPQEDRGDVSPKQEAGWQDWWKRYPGW